MSSLELVPVTTTNDLNSVVTQNHLEMSASPPPLSMDLLPNEILGIIINDADISLQKRIQFRAVSTRWLAVIEDDLKKETEIIIRERYDDSRYYYQRKKLVVSSSKYFNADFSTLLTRLFSLAKLTVDIKTVPYFDQLPEVLSKFTTLKSFTFYGFYPRQKLPESIPRIADALNSLPNLTHLNLALCDISVPINIYLASYLGPTLSRLEDFSLMAYEPDPYEDDYFWLGPHCPTIMESLSDRCTSLRLNQALFHQSTPQFTSSLTHLHLSYASEYGLDLCRNLTALTSLSVKFGYPLYLTTDLMRTLSNLKQLTDLNMGRFKYWNELGDWYDGNDSDDSFDPNGIENLENPVKPLDPPSVTDHPLVNLKKLHLTAHYRCVFECTHGCKSLVAWCPNLVELNIKCTICNHGEYAANLDVFSSDTVVSVETI